jgi:hypothetical protein
MDKPVKTIKVKKGGSTVVKPEKGKGNADKS